MSLGIDTRQLWDPPHCGRTTIQVIDSGEKALDEREEKIEKGAKVVPFGFSRALFEDDDAH